MSEKKYQISPIELVRWAEPLFGFGKKKAGKGPENRRKDRDDYGTGTRHHGPCGQGNG